MLKIAVFVFNPFQENTYVVSDNSGECIIIDAGNYTSAEDNALMNYLEDKNLKPVKLVNTHGHVDHLLGVNFLKEQFNIPFAVNSLDEFLVQGAKDHGAMYGFKMDSAPLIDIDLKGQTELSFGESTFKIINTPGHTPGHIALYQESEKILFTGDTLFKESIGRTDLPGGDYEQIMTSILENIMPLGGDVKIYSGHGPSSDLGHEIMYNPFIVDVVQGEVNYK